MTLTRREWFLIGYEFWVSGTVDSSWLRYTLCERTCPWMASTLSGRSECPMLMLLLFKSCVPRMVIWSDLHGWLDRFPPSVFSTGHDVCCWYMFPRVKSRYEGSLGSPCISCMRFQKCFFILRRERGHGEWQSLHLAAHTSKSVYIIYIHRNSTLINILFIFHIWLVIHQYVIVCMTFYYINRYVASSFDMYVIVHLLRAGASGQPFQPCLQPGCPEGTAPVPTMSLFGPQLFVLNAPESCS